MWAGEPCSKHDHRAAETYICYTFIDLYNSIVNRNSGRIFITFSSSNMIEVSCAA